MVAVDHSEPKLLVINTANDTVEVTIPLQGNTKASFKPRFSPDGSKLLVCNMTERLVNIIDVADPHGKQHVIPVGKDPMGFAFAPDGKTVLVANHGDGTVSVIDLSQNKVVSSFHRRRRRGIPGVLLNRDREVRVRVSGASFFPAPSPHKRPARSSRRRMPLRCRLRSFALRFILDPSGPAKHATRRSAQVFSVTEIAPSIRNCSATCPCSTETNCGMNERKNSAVFGFSTSVITP